MPNWELTVPPGNLNKKRPWLSFGLKYFLTFNAVTSYWWHNYLALATIYLVAYQNDIFGQLVFNLLDGTLEHCIAQLKAKWCLII